MARPVSLRLQGCTLFQRVQEAVTDGQGRGQRPAAGDLTPPSGGLGIRKPGNGRTQCGGFSRRHDTEGAWGSCSLGRPRRRIAGLAWEANHYRARGVDGFGQLTFSLRSPGDLAGEVVDSVTSGARGFHASTLTPGVGHILSQAKKNFQVFLLGIALAASAAATPRDLTFTDGTVLPGARIVSLGADHCEIVHAGGVGSYPVALIRTEDLVQAWFEIQRRPPPARPDERPPEAAAPKPVQLKPETKAVEPPKPALPLQRLKAAYPAAGKVRVAKPYTRPRQVFEIDVPHPDIWSYYRGALLAATSASAGITLDRLEVRLGEDYRRLEGLAATRDGANFTEGEQARRTLLWIDRELWPHLQNWRQHLP